jgi:hypothetical protein
MEVGPGFVVSLEWTNNHFVKGQVVIAVVRTEKAAWITLNDAFEPVFVTPSRDVIGTTVPPLFSNISIKNTLELRHINSKLRTCDEHHGRHCHRDSQRAEVVSIFLIDTQNLCIVPSDTESPYFTLSYRWGQTTNAGLTRDNVDALLRPGGLHEIWHKISRVVREAIQLVAELDIYTQRYLWVDSLCILQDDQEHKHTQIRQMGAIYNRAAMTIIALSAVNADSALLVPQKQLCETHKALGEVERRKRVRLVPDYRISTRLMEQADRSDYVYRSRGWTFQEEKLSRRVLYCTDSGMLFRCRVLLSNRPWYDDDWRTKAASETTLKSEIIRQWLTIVTEYSKRQFTYPSDTLRGFAGIADTLKHPVSGEIPLNVVCGVCLEWFPYSLYWKPEILKGQKRHSFFPTWSWASCIGAIDFPNASDVYTTYNFEAQLVSPPIPLYLRDDTTQGTSVNGDGSSFDSQRSNIRDHARALLSLETPQDFETRSLSKRSMAIGVDTFYMLNIRVKLKVLKWSSLRLTIQEHYTRHSYESQFWRGKKHAGYADVAPGVFIDSGMDTIAFVPLFERDEVVFLVVRCVGKNLYERLGTGWIYVALWPLNRKGSSDEIVYLI